MDLSQLRHKSIVLRLAVVLLLLSPASLTYAEANSTRNDSQHFAWYKLNYKASKFGLNATTEITIRQQSINDYTEQLEALDIPHHGSKPLYPNDPLGYITLKANYAGRTTHFSTWLELPSGKALQSSRSRSGLTKNEQKIYRFTEKGVIEVKQKEDSVKNNFISLKNRQIPSNLTQPIYLFYLVSNSPQLRNVGDSLELPVYANKGIYTFKLLVEEQVNIATEYQLGMHGEVLKKRYTEALKISVKPTPLNSAHREKPVKLAGLDNGVFFYLEKNSRLPIELRGNMNIFGQVRYILQRAQLTP